MREVRAPYAETTTIRAGEATIARAGKAPRTFSLSRVPELAGLQAELRRAALRRSRATGTALPLDAAGHAPAVDDDAGAEGRALAAKVRDIALYGRGAELRCIETRPVERRELQRTLLAGAARARRRQSADADALAALCRGDGAAPR